MQNAEVIGTEDVVRAAGAAQAHEARGPLSRFAFAVLSRQAEGQTLFAGKKHVDTLAEEHGVSREDAATERGNVLEIFERGADTSAERSLVASFAVAGLSAELAEGDATPTLTSFVRHADWLETATPYAIYAFVDHVLSVEDAARVWDAVADACVSARPAPLDHAARAAVFVRISALAASSSDAAKEALARVAKHAADPALRAAAAFRAGDDAQGNEVEGRPSRIGGTRGRVRGGAFQETLRIVSGWALLTWGARLLASLVGLSRTVEAALSPNGIELRSQIRLLGRVVREQEELIPLSGLARITRDVRYPVIHLLVGLTMLSLGILVGGVMAVDAARSGATWFLVLGALLILGGAGLDLAIDVLIPARRRRVAIELAPAGGAPRRIEGIGAESAERFIEAVRAKL